MDSSIFSAEITKILQENSKKNFNPTKDTSWGQFSDSMTDEDINKFIKRVGGVKK